MSAAEKEKYEALAEADAERYDREYAVWEKEQAAKPPAAAATPTAQTKKKPAAALGPAPPPPAKPLKAYILFTNEKRADIKAQNPTATAPEMMKLLGARWKATPEDEKKTYNDRATQLKAKYTADMAAWRKKYPAHAKQLDKELAEKKEASKKKRQAKNKPGESAPAPSPKESGKEPKQTKLVAKKRESKREEEGDGEAVAAPPQTKKAKK